MGFTRSRRAWLGVVAAASLSALGCIAPDTTRCGDLVCPVGKVCDLHRVSCVLPAQLEVCTEEAQGAACSYPDVPGGACDEGVCYPIVCGNALLEPGERCDDGNTASGDGCRGDCGSDERCGNQLVDLGSGEECDDGNQASHDGCSSACLIEVPGWSELNVERAPRGTYAALAYDAARQRAVRFGGYSPTGGVTSGTVEWNGVTRGFETVRPPHAPPPRARHALAYDAARRRVVLFGGVDAAGAPVGDTWSYNGGDWSEVTSTPSPAPRSDTALAYDAARARVVLFGGETANGSVADETWEHDGTAWIQRVVASPPARRAHLLAYDAVRQRTVLFGGETADGTALNDTWEWDGTSWQAIATATVPGARGVMTWDARRAAIVAFGGHSVPGDETWEYRGVDWAAVTLATRPPPRAGTVMAYDAARGRAVIISGGVGVMGADYQDVWEYDGTAWEQIEVVDSPPRRNSAGFVYDPRNGVHVFYGGMTPPSTLQLDTWTFDGVEWVQREPLGAPGGDRCPMGPCPAGVVYDTTRGRMVLVRQPPMGPSNETWVYDGGRWTRLDTTGAPPARRFAGMAYDPVRDRVVLFGGVAQPGSAFGDTWELDGDTWIETTDPAGPTARNQGPLVWDSRRARIVLYGGLTADGTRLDDTWSYDGAWTQLAPASSPPPTSGAGITFLEGRGSVLIFGGELGTTPNNRLWEFDDTTWTEIVVTNPPVPRKSPHLAWDPVQDQVLLSGGDPQDDTWQLQWSSATPDERCDDGMDQDGDGLIDCADPDCEEAACGSGLVCRAGSCDCRGGDVETHCSDGRDDDCDGVRDCDDPDCTGVAPCQAEAACDDGADDDGDQLTDCADPGCAGQLSCERFETRCGDGVDNDGDLLVDCADPDCFLVVCTEVTP